MRYEPNGMMLLTNSVFKCYRVFERSVRKIKRDIMPQKITSATKAQEIEDIKKEVANVGIQEVMAKIDTIVTVLNELANRYNAVVHNLETAWKRIEVLETEIAIMKAPPKKAEAGETNEAWKCDVCEKEYPTLEEAEACEEKHKLEKKAAAEEPEEIATEAAEDFEPVDAPLMAADIPDTKNTPKKSKK